MGVNKLTPLQKKLLAIIEKIDEICRKHDITYFLGGGTALGAVRHRGFLPWDDDADLYITRDNWLKLKDKLEIELPSELTMVTNETHPYYRNPLCRVVDEESAIFYRTRVADETPHGVQVEFFLLDPIPNCEEERKVYFRNRWLYIELLSSYFLLANDRLPEEVTNVNAYIKKRVLAKIIGEKRVLSDLEQKLFYYKQDECDDVILRWGQRMIIYEKEIFEAADYIEFEGIKLPVSHQVIKQLRIDYGDSWMIVPSSDAQIVHTFWGDLNISYLEHMKYIKKHIDLPEMRKNLLKRKTRNVLRYRHQLVMKHELITLKKVANEMRLSQILADHDDLSKSFLEGRYLDIVNGFSEYIGMQLNPIFLKKNIFLDINDEILYFILYSMVIVGRYYDAGRILKVRAQEDSTLTDLLTELNDLIKSISDINVSKYSNNLLECEQEIQLLLRDHPQQLDLVKVNLILKIDQKDCFDELEATINDMLELYENDGELISFLGDLYYNKNQYDKAKKMYQQATEATRNGMVLLRVFDRIEHLGQK